MKCFKRHILIFEVLENMKKNEFTLTEVAELLGLTHMQIRHLIRQGKIQARKDSQSNSAYWVIPCEEVKKIVEIMEQRKVAKMIKNNNREVEIE